jgi:hypothetical protein
MKQETLTVWDCPREGRPALALLGHASYVIKPAMIRTERGKLVAYRYLDVRQGMDVSSFVKGQEEVGGEVSL